jgi:Zn-finger nucleic acid-binding protein
MRAQPKKVRDCRALDALCWPGDSERVTSQTKTCPRDGTNLAEQRYEAAVMVDVCLTCAGVWLDERKLEAIQESRERDYRRDLDTMAETVGPIGEHAPGARCPQCSVAMDNREYAHCSRVTVDVCPEGHGIWLDGGELRALEMFFEKAKLSANTEDEGLWALRSFWVSLKTLFHKK